ncbi:MAG: copper chaperone [Ferruginibacter sp.]
MEILVFKTNLNNNKHIRKVKPALNLHPYIKEWNVDLHDCDKILRVISENNSAHEIKQILFTAGYFCEELN